MAKRKQNEEGEPSEEADDGEGAASDGEATASGVHDDGSAIEGDEGNPTGSRVDTGLQIRTHLLHWRRDETEDQPEEKPPKPNTKFDLQLMTPKRGGGKKEPPSIGNMSPSRRKK